MNPVLLLVIADAASRGDMSARLDGRFGSDYTVEASASAAEALDRLRALRDAGVPVTMAFETSMPGVFSAGDVRAGSVERVATAAGEGAVVVPMIHSLLAGTAHARPPRR